MSDSWKNIVLALEKNIAPGQFQALIKPLRGHREDETLVLFAPNEFIRERVRRGLLSRIQDAASQVLGFSPAVDLRLAPAEQLPTAMGTQLVSRQLCLPVAQTQPVQDLFRWRYQFDDFVVGPCNQMAYLASSSFCQEAKGADQLFLCAAPGLGKTHLVQAIGHGLARRLGAPVRVCYLGAEELVRQMGAAFRNKTIGEFTNRLRNEAEVFLLDDVQCLEGKAKMQEELFYALKFFRQNGRRVVLTSSSAPGELKGIEPQLVSRFTQGLVVSMQAPDYETRRKIILECARLKGAHMSESVVGLLAERLRRDIRQIKSCLENIIWRADGQEISMSLVWECLADFDVPQKFMDIEEIKDFVCRVFAMNMKDLCAKSRKQDRVLARQTAFFLARQYTTLSTTEIGRHFQRTHSTVLKGINAVNLAMSRQTTLGNQLTHIIGKLKP